MIQLRKALRADLPRLREWSRDFEHGAHGEPYIERTWHEFDRHPERGELLIIERDGAAVGYTILVSWWSNEFRGEAVLLDELYVAPENRGGVGTDAVRAIEERVRARGTKLLSLEVLPDATRVHSLYQRAGFKSGRTLYQKRLG